MQQRHHKEGRDSCQGRLCKEEREVRVGHSKTDHEDCLIPEGIGLGLHGKGEGPDGVMHKGKMSGRQIHARSMACDGKFGGGGGGGREQQEMGGRGAR